MGVADELLVQSFEPRLRQAFVVDGDRLVAGRPGQSESGAEFWVGS